MEILVHQLTALRNTKVQNYICKTAYMASQLISEYAIAGIAALPASLTMQKNGKGSAIPLFFCYASQAGKTTLHAIQLMRQDHDRI